MRYFFIERRSPGGVFHCSVQDLAGPEGLASDFVLVSGLLSDFVSGFVSDFESDFVSDFESDFISDFASDFVSDFASDFESDLESDFASPLSLPASCAAGFGFLKSVAYHPLPFKWNPAEVSIFRNDSLPHSGHAVSAGSLSFRRYSFWNPQDEQRYS